MNKAWWVSLGILVAAAQILVADTPQPVYFAGEEEIELEVIPTLLSVSRPVEDNKPETLLATLGLEGTAATATPLTPGVWVVDLARMPPLDKTTGSQPVPAPTTSVEEELRRQQTLIDRALRDPATEWAYPALRNPQTGTILFLTPEVIISSEGALEESRLRSLRAQGLRLARPLQTESLYLLELISPQHDDPLAKARQLTEDYDWIQWAEPNFIQEWQRQAAPNDPLFSEQWHLLNTGQGGGVSGADGRLTNAWDVETGDGTIVIAVLDDGVQTNHPDLPIFTNPNESSNGLDDDGNGLIDDLQGWDFFSNDNDPNPCTSAPCSSGVGSHGTAVAGVAAATGNNSTGGTGSCRNCQILPLRISNHATGAFTTNANITDAIEYAGQLADILNNSWGGGSPSAAITTAIQNADANGRGGLGSPVFFASGNSASGYQTFTLTGIPAGTWTFTWTYRKDGSVSSGFDTAWLDDVLFQDGSSESFENCTSLPTGWLTGGNANWVPVDDESRARSTFGGHCSVRAGSITHNQDTWIAVTKSFAVSGDLRFSLWRSSEPAGPLTVSTGCFDLVELTAFDGTTTFGPFFPACGTFSNQGNPLQDGTLSYPASVAEAVAVGAATNFDTRSDYSQWQSSELDFLCHSSGGTLGITTTDLTGSVGYDATDYTDAFAASGFGGTSSATPLCAGIAGLLLSNDPTLTSAEIRASMQTGTRKIGSLPYSGGRNDLYGFGVVNAQLALETSTGCPPDLMLSNQTVTTTETFKASSSITTGPSFSVGNGGTVTLKSGNRVVMESGTSIQSGASLAVIISPNPCL